MYLEVEELWSSELCKFVSLDTNLGGQHQKQIHSGVDNYLGCDGLA